MMSDYHASSGQVVSFSTSSDQVFKHSRHGSRKRHHLSSPMLMIVSIHYQPTEEIHHVLDFHSDNDPWFRAGEVGRSFRDGYGFVGVLVPRSARYRRAGNHAAMAEAVCGK